MSTLDDLWGPMVSVESGGNPDAIGQAGEIGLVQIKPELAAEYGVSKESLHHPAVQRMLFDKIMGKYLTRYGGDLTRAVGAWNAGQGAVDRGHVPMGYVGKVFAKMPRAVSSARTERLATAQKVGSSIPPRRTETPALWNLASATEPPAEGADLPTRVVPATSRPAVPTQMPHGLLEDRMRLLLLTMGLSHRMSRLVASAYGDLYRHPVGLARLRGAHLPTLIANDMPKLYRMLSALRGFNV